MLYVSGAVEQPRGTMFLDGIAVNIEERSCCPTYGFDIAIGSQVVYGTHGRLRLR